jgi:hypothetical protein
MTTTALPAAGPRPAGRRWTRRGLAAALAVAAAAAVLLPRSGHPAPAAPRTRGAVADWFTDASGRTCGVPPGSDRLPGAVDAVTCPLPGLSAVFGEMGSPAIAQAYVDGQARAHEGSILSAWSSGHPSEHGRVVFYVAAGRSTVVWTYDGRPFVGVATSASRRTVIDWWGRSGRSTRSGKHP